jgi:hypothetical protein
MDSAAAPVRTVGPMLFVMDNITIRRLYQVSTVGAPKSAQSPRSGYTANQILVERQLVIQ